MGNPYSTIPVIIDCLKSKNFIIINVTNEIISHCFKITLTDNQKNDTVLNEFRPIKKKIRKILSKEEILSIFQLIEKSIKYYSGRVIFIIFNEYFFGNKPIKEYERNAILEMLFKYFKNNNNQIFFLLNFLFRLANPLNKEQIQDLKDYLLKIEANNELFNVTISNKDTLIHDKSNVWYTNESILLYKNKIIFTQRKQTFFNELNIMEDNFCLGFGGKETKLDKNDPEYDLFLYFNSAINLDICLDIQKKLSYNRNLYMTESICYLTKEDQNKIKKKRDIFKRYNNGNDYKEKEFYIIQSNSTNINDCLGLFPNNKIIIQVDPKSSGIFLTNYSDAFKYKIEDLNKQKENSYKKLKDKNESFLKSDLVNRNSQNIEYYRTKKNIKEVLDEKLEEYFKKNFYNITELIRPDDYLIEDVGNIRLSILIHDLNNLKKIIKKS